MRNHGAEEPPTHPPTSGIAWPDSLDRGQELHDHGLTPWDTATIEPMIELTVTLTDEQVAEIAQRAATAAECSCIATSSTPTWNVRLPDYVCTPS